MIEQSAYIFNCFMGWTSALTRTNKQKSGHPKWLTDMLEPCGERKRPSKLSVMIMGNCIRSKRKGGSENILRSLFVNSTRLKKATPENSQRSL